MISSKAESDATKLPAHAHVCASALVGPACHNIHNTATGVDRDQTLLTACARASGVCANTTFFINSPSCSHTPRHRSTHNTRHTIATRFPSKNTGHRLNTCLRHCFPCYRLVCALCAVAFVVERVVCCAWHGVCFVCVACCRTVWCVG